MARCGVGGCGVGCGGWRGSPRRTPVAGRPVRVHVRVAWPWVGGACSVGTEREMCTLSTVSGFTSRFRGSYRTFFHSASPSAMTVDEQPATGGATHQFYTTPRDWVLRSPDRSLGSAQRASGYRKSGPSRVPALGGRVLSLHGAASPAHEIRTRRTSSRSTSGTGPVTTSTSVTK